MAAPNVIIDPNGEIIIILRKTSRQDHENARREPLNEPRLLESQGNSFETVSTMLKGYDKTKLTYPDPDDPTEWQFKVSRKQLALACSNCRFMLNALSPGIIPPDNNVLWYNGLWYWEIKDYRPKAMFFVLSAIHGKDQRIPRKLDFDALADVARVANFFGCHEIMQLYTSSWIHHLKDEFPESYDDKLLAWICIAGTFHETEVFKRCTRQAILEDRNDYHILPPPQVVDDIAQRRISGLNKIFEHLYEFVDNVIRSTLCSLEGDAHNLGIFIKYMHTNLLMPRPTSPYRGLSIAMVVKKIANLSNANFLVLGRDPVYYGPPGFSDSLESIFPPPVAKDVNGEMFEFYYRLNQLIALVNRVAEQVEGLDYPT
ncbi:hypothetical protein GGR58DRAFT_502467 [Xylaria digitata]|nr:hypothetical protein GGR58DRAFT_502467 [Xylaria digitata]